MIDKPTTTASARAPHPTLTLESLSRKVEELKAPRLATAMAFSPKTYARVVDELRTIIAAVPAIDRGAPPTEQPDGDALRYHGLQLIADGRLPDNYGETRDAHGRVLERFAFAPR